MEPKAKIEIWYQSQWIKAEPIQFENYCAYKCYAGPENCPNLFELYIPKNQVKYIINLN